MFADCKPTVHWCGRKKKAANNAESPKGTLMDARTKGPGIKRPRVTGTEAISSINRRCCYITPSFTIFKGTHVQHSKIFQLLTDDTSCQIDNQGVKKNVLRFLSVFNKAELHATFLF